MSEPLSILHLEDNPQDAELVYALMEEHGITCQPTRVQSKDEFQIELKKKEFDLIISDFTLPSFDGVSALKMAHELSPETPFIFVSGTLGEESAVNSLLNGATDYVLKHRMDRLVPAVQRALRETSDRRERRKAEQALLLQTSYFQQLFENLPEGVVLVDMNGRVIKANKAFERMFQYSLDEIKGHSVIDFIVPEANVADAQKLTDESAKGRVVKQDAIRKRKDGSLLDVLIVGFPIMMEGQKVSVYGMYVDITDRKKIEMQFLRAQRLESIGTLAGGIAHDLNNVLGPIMLCLDIMRRRVQDPEIHKLINTIDASTRRGSDLIKQVLSFARGDLGEHIPIQIKHLVHEIGAIIRETFPRFMTLRIDLPKNLWTIMGDATQLHQVLMNLCVNARDAMPHGGTIQIKGENIVLDEQYAGMHPEASLGRHVAISVTDTGTGVLPEIQEKMFEPFFTTKEIGKGTGLGLSTVKTVVKNHGGFLNVYSEPGKGTTFRIYFPAEEPAGAQDVEKPAVVARGKGELILVVDDEEAVREITRATLEAFGYAVITASDGTDAVVKYAEQKTKISVVLTDMMMPYMDGTATVRALRKMNPDVRIVAVSGLPQSGSHLLNLPHLVQLQKPFTSDQLLQALRTLIDE